MITKEIRIPDIDQIIDFEKEANNYGSGIKGKDLIGVWMFKYVWKKGSNQIDNFSSSILQVLSANLELTKKDLEEEIPTFHIKNSVQIGLISFVFSGKAFLKGKRPLLFFYFQRFFIKLGSINLLEKCFEEKDFKTMPFFSLIKIDNKNNQMIARGKGGGLAIWIKS